MTVIVAHETTPLNTSPVTLMVPRCISLVTRTLTPTGCMEEVGTTVIPNPSSIIVLWWVSTNCSYHTRVLYIVTVISIHQLLVRTLFPLWPLWLVELPGLGCYWFSTKKKGLTHYTIEVSVNPLLYTWSSTTLTSTVAYFTTIRVCHGGSTSLWEWIQCIRDEGRWTSRPEDNVDYEIVRWICGGPNVCEVTFISLLVWYLFTFHWTCICMDHTVFHGLKLLMWQLYEN